MSNEVVQVLDWDSKFFGYTVGKTLIERNISQHENTISEAMKNCGIRLLYHFQDPNIKEDIVHLSNMGAYLVDQRVTLKCKIQQVDEGFENLSILEFDENQSIESLYDIGLQIKEWSRFSYDPYIDEEKVTELYKLWIYNGIKNKFCDKTFIFKDEEKICGLIMLQVDRENKSANLSLVGVDQEERGKSIASQLISKAKSYLASLGISDFYVVTEFRNVGALNLYIKNAFLINDTKLIYHLYNER